MKSSKILPLILVVFVVALCGCETMKGLKQDVKNTWKNMTELDEKFKDNWW